MHTQAGIAHDHAWHSMQYMAHCKALHANNKTYYMHKYSHQSDYACNTLHTHIVVHRGLLADGAVLQLRPGGWLLITNVKAHIRQWTSQALCVTADKTTWLKVMSHLQFTNHSVAILEATFHACTVKTRL
jgi:hypothetical protein